MSRALAAVRPFSGMPGCYNSTLGLRDALTHGRAARRPSRQRASGARRATAVTRAWPRRPSQVQRPIPSPPHVALRRPRVPASGRSPSVPCRLRHRGRRKVKRRWSGRALGGSVAHLCAGALCGPGLMPSVGAGMGRAWDRFRSRAFGTLAADAVVSAVRVPCVALPAPGVILVAAGSPACPTCRHDGRRALSARLQRAAQFTTAHVVAEEARRQHASRITWPGRPPSTDSLQPRQGGCITVGRRRERIVSVHRPDPVCAATQSSCSAFLPHGLL